MERRRGMNKERKRRCETNLVVNGRGGLRIVRDRSNKWKDLTLRENLTLRSTAYIHDGRATQDLGTVQDEYLGSGVTRLLTKSFPRCNCSLPRYTRNEGFFMSTTENHELSPMWHAIDFCGHS